MPKIPWPSYPKIRVRRISLQHEYMLGDIYAIDETPVLSEMVSNSTVEQVGKRTVTMKSKRYEKGCVSLCF